MKINGFSYIFFPGSSNVRSLLKKESSTVAKKTNFLQRLANFQTGRYFQTGLTENSYKSQWHTQLAKNMKLLRRTFGHLSSVYCLIFDRSGQLVLTGADDMLVKCWSFIGKKHALKKYDQFALNTSCFGRNYPSCAISRNF